VKILWVTHRNIAKDEGGAEWADFEMIHRRPEGIDITLIKPGGVDEDLTDTFDKVVVTGWWGFTPREVNIISRWQPIVWLHDTQMSGHWLNADAQKLIVLTPRHKEYELAKLPIIHDDRIFINPGYMDIDFLDLQGPKQHFALWAHRPVAHKGLDLAAEWAEQQDIRLEVMVNAPRLDVLMRMGHAEYFVLMSHIVDPGPRAVMEAQLLGCKLAVNDNVGWFDEPPDKLAERLTSADKQFWQLVLE
jgi:hypothetical protein